jgi:hypothetical protein
MSDCVQNEMMMIRLGSFDTQVGIPAFLLTNYVDRTRNKIKLLVRCEPSEKKN